MEVACEKHSTSPRLSVRQQRSVPPWGTCHPDGHTRHWGPHTHGGEPGSSSGQLHSFKAHVVAVPSPEQQYSHTGLGEPIPSAHAGSVTAELMSLSGVYPPGPQG
jgi:hypothetical protein